jgi:membrane-bound ClpP family serine protease
MILILISSSVHPVMSSAPTLTGAILVRVNVTIDYRMADLFEDAARDIESGKATTLLVELDSGDGYLAPTMQIVDRLASLNAKVITYVGPQGARASTFAAYIAMAGKVLVINSGASIGGVSIDSGGPSSRSYMTNMMGKLAATNNRNPEAAERMVTDNVEYPAKEAFAKGICNLVVDNYEHLLASFKIDPQNITEKNQSQSLNVNRDTAYEVLKLFANVTAIRYMTFAAAILIVLDFILLMARPRRGTPDEAYQRLLDLMKMEMHAFELASRGRTSGSLNETELQTPANIPCQPVSQVNRLPTPLPGERLERPLEVKKR